MSSPEPIFSHSRQGLGQEEQVALGTRFDWIESNRESNQISRFKLPVTDAF